MDLISRNINGKYDCDHKRQVIRQYSLLVLGIFKNQNTLSIFYSISCIVAHTVCFVY